MLVLILTCAVYYYLAISVVDQRVLSPSQVSAVVKSATKGDLRSDFFEALKALPALRALMAMIAMMTLQGDVLIQIKVYTFRNCTISEHCGKHY